jgi:hypothetical protein
MIRTPSCYIRRKTSQKPIFSSHPQCFPKPFHPPVHRPYHLVSTMDASPKMLRSNRLKQVFDEGKRPAWGFWQVLPGANMSRLLARSGVDWVIVDCEHGNIDGMQSTPVSLRGQTGIMTLPQMARCTTRSLPSRRREFPLLFACQTPSHGW